MTGEIDRLQKQFLELFTTLAKARGGGTEGFKKAKSDFRRVLKTARPLRAKPKPPQKKRGAHSPSRDAEILKILTVYYPIEVDQRKAQGRPAITEDEFLQKFVDLGAKARGWLDTPEHKARLRKLNSHKKRTDPTFEPKRERNEPSARFNYGNSVFQLRRRLKRLRTGH
jgi:hypothetical protein